MAQSNQYRLLNRDGSFNIIRRGGQRRPTRDLYHRMQQMDPGRFLLAILAVFISVNLLFASAYDLCGAGALEGAREGGFLERFPDCFFFSVETFATIGYGELSPRGLPAHLLMTLEAFFGLLAAAVLTGLVFARFSRPTARIIFSDVAVVTCHDRVPSLVFRLANERLNQIMEAKVMLSLAIDERTVEGEFYRNFYTLELERSLSPIFALSWTVVHPITPASPLYGKSKEDLIRANAEIFASFSGLDDTFSQTIHARFSYTGEEILWEREFEDMLERSEDRKVIVHLEKIHRLRET